MVANGAYNDGCFFILKLIDCTFFFPTSIWLICAFLYFLFIFLGQYVGFSGFESVVFEVLFYLGPISDFDVVANGLW